MSKVSVSEAVALTGKSEATIRRDIKSGKVSSDKDDRGRRVIDMSEVSRVYGITPPSPDSKKTDNDGRVIAILEARITDLQQQLRLANERESNLTRLADRLTLALPERKQGGWLSRLFGSS